MTIGIQTVPDRLLGCWRRNWIRFGADGDHERHVAVIWLQTASGMGDVRIDATQRPEDTDSSCGITVVDESTTPFPTADWLDGDTGFSQQPVSRFPEKGLLDWHTDSLLYERAPSGAYVEEWERLGGSDGLIEHHVGVGTPTRVNRYRAGRHVFVAVERMPGDSVHEFSYGTQSPTDSSVIIELSTVADRIAQPMNFDGHEWQLVSRRSI